MEKDQERKISQCHLERGIKAECTQTSPFQIHFFLNNTVMWASPHLGDKQSMCLLQLVCRQWLRSERILVHRSLVETSRLPEVKSGLFKGPLLSWKCLWLRAVKKQYRHPQLVFTSLHERVGIRKGLDWGMPRQTHTLLLWKSNAEVFYWKPSILGRYRK